MKWNKLTIDTTTAAVDMIAYSLEEMGIQGVVILDHVPLTEEDRKTMYVDLLPDDIAPDDGTAKISFTQAALGATIKIDTIDGPMEYDIKPGTQTDTRVRLSKKGIPTIRNKNVRGDHYVTFVVKVPEKLNDAQRKALRAFQEAMGEVEPAKTEGEDGKEESGKKKSFWKK